MDHGSKIRQALNHVIEEMDQAQPNELSKYAYHDPEQKFPCPAEERLALTEATKLAGKKFTAETGLDPQM